MKCKEIPYNRVEKEAMEQTFSKLHKQFIAAKSGEEQWKVHLQYHAYLDDIMTMCTLAGIRHDGNVEDPFYKKEQAYYDALLPILEKYKIAYEKALYESPYRSFLEEKMGQVAFRNLELKQKAFHESLIPLMQEENELVTKYCQCIANAKIPFQGQIFNLSLLQKYLVHQNREIRKEAYQKQSDFFQSVAEELDEIYDRLVKNRTKQAEKLGYTTYIPLGYARMRRNCYDAEMVKRFREQVKREVVPIASKIQENRRRRLGLEKLYYFDSDLYFAEGNPAPIGDAMQILQAGEQMYHALSKETDTFFQFMKQHELFDVFGRKNKRAGGYMTTLANIHAPFIFANFNGTSADVDVITHECGHAFQAFLTREVAVAEYRDLTMEMAEVHSMSMEFFTEPWMELFFGERAEDYRRMHLESSILFLPYGCMVDEFQHLIYENPTSSKQERKNMWLDLEKQYRPDLDYAKDPFFSSGGYWQKQGHIYQSPFYYIDYVLAMVCALQWRNRMQSDYQSAWEAYIAFAKASASEFFTDLIEKVGLQSPFAEDAVHNLMHIIQEREKK